MKVARTISIHIDLLNISHGFDIQYISWPGVQAQTVANFYLAFGNDLVVVPVLNKIDLKNADPEAVKEQLFMLFDIDPDDILLASAKMV